MEGACLSRGLDEPVLNLEVPRRQSIVCAGDIDYICFANRFLDIVIISESGMEGVFTSISLFSLSCAPTGLFVQSLDILVEQDLRGSTLEKTV